MYLVYQPNARRNIHTHPNRCLLSFVDFRPCLPPNQVIVQPTVDVQGKTGEVVVAAELDGDTTSAELTVNHAEESAVLEVCHRLDDNNVVSPKVDLKTGDIAVRLNRSLGDDRAVKVTAQRENVDWEYLEGAWVVKGNLPLTSSGSTGAISFKRSITL